MFLFTYSTIVGMIDAIRRMSGDIDSTAKTDAQPVAGIANAFYSTVVSPTINTTSAGVDSNSTLV